MKFFAPGSRSTEILFSSTLVSLVSLLACLFVSWIARSYSASFHEIRRKGGTFITL